MGVHDGHRKRLRARFLSEGIDGFEDYQVLELLLFFAIPRVDTNETAHRLLNMFGSLDRVFEADFETLCEVEGIGENAATLIRLMSQIGRKRVMSSVKPGSKINNSTAAGQYFVEVFRSVTEEQMYMMCLDSQKRLIKCLKLFTGSLEQVDVDMRKLVETALKWKASAVIISHNHVSGLAIPSSADIATTVNICRALENIGIEFCDHVIVAENDFVSVDGSGSVVMRR